MGKDTGFLEFQREQPGRRKVEERLHDWFEIYNPFPEEKQREQGARCMDCGVPFATPAAPSTTSSPIGTTWFTTAAGKPPSSVSTPPTTSLSSPAVSVRAV